MLLFPQLLVRLWSNKSNTDYTQKSQVVKAVLPQDTVSIPSLLTCLIHGCFTSIYIEYRKKQRKYVVMLQRWLWLLFNVSYLLKKFFSTSEVYGK